MFSVGQSSRDSPARSGKTRRVAADGPPVQTSPFAAMLRTSNSGYAAGSRTSTIWSARPGTRRMGFTPPARTSSR